MVAVAFGRSDSHHRDLCAITASPASTGEFALRFVDDSPLEEDGFEPLVPPWKRGGVFPEKGLFNTGHGSRRVHEGGPTGEFRIESLDDSTARFPPLTCAGAIARFSGTPPGSAIHPAVPDAHGRRGAGSSRLLGGRAGPRSRVAAARR